MDTLSWLTGYLSEQLHKNHKQGSADKGSA